MLIHSDLDGQLDARSALKFSVHADTASLGSSALFRSDGEVEFCVLLDAERCTCDRRSMVRDLLYDRSSNEVMRQFSVILPPSCVPPSSRDIDGRLHSYAVEVFSSSGNERESEISSPVYFGTGEGNMATQRAGKMTLVLPLTMKDMRRSLILFRTLAGLPRPSCVHELLVLCPDTQAHDIAAELGDFYKGLGKEQDFPIRVVGENTLFARGGIPASADKYGLQMALKLLVAKVVQTPFYLTLDADLVLLKPELLSSVLLATGGKRAVFEDEGRDVHPEWWMGSAALLGLAGDQKDVMDSSEKAGFGVTPSALSTFGARLTVREVLLRVSECFPMNAPTQRTPQGGTASSDLALLEEVWLTHFLRPYGGDQTERKAVVIDAGGSSSSSTDEGTGGQCLPEGQVVLWSEYTLYRLALGHKHVFHGLHSAALHPWQAEAAARGEPSQQDPPVGGGEGGASPALPPALHCFDVWYQGDLPWKANLALGSHTRCLFSVIQSSSDADPAFIEAQLAKFVPR